MQLELLANTSNATAQVDDSAAEKMEMLNLVHATNVNDTYDFATTTTGVSTVADTYAWLCAARTPPAKRGNPAAKRQGAKKAKALEKLQSIGPILNSEEATSYRA